MDARCSEAGFSSKQMRTFWQSELSRKIQKGCLKGVNHIPLILWVEAEVRCLFVTNNTMGSQTPNRLEVANQKIWDFWNQSFPGIWPLKRLNFRVSHTNSLEGQTPKSTIEWYLFLNIYQSVQLLSRVWLCDPMDCSTPGFPVHHQLPELAQTHVHRVSDAIQPSHPLSSPSPPAFNLPQHQGIFQWVSSLHQVTKVLEFQF